MSHLMHSCNKHAYNKASHTHIKYTTTMWIWKWQHTAVATLERQYYACSFFGQQLLSCCWKSWLSLNNMWKNNFPLCRWTYKTKCWRGSQLNERRCTVLTLRSAKRQKCDIVAGTGFCLKLMHTDQLEVSGLVTAVITQTVWLKPSLISIKRTSPDDRSTIFHVDREVEAQLRKSEWSGSVADL